MPDDNMTGLDDLVSPSDRPLLELLFENTSYIKKLTDIFRDRNSDRITLCLKFAVVTLLIEQLFEMTVSTDDVINFISILNEKEMEDDED